MTSPSKIRRPSGLSGQDKSNGIMDEKDDCDLLPLLITHGTMRGGLLIKLNSSTCFKRYVIYQCIESRPKEVMILTLPSFGSTSVVVIFFIISILYLLVASEVLISTPAGDDSNDNGGIMATFLVSVCMRYKYSKNYDSTQSAVMCE